MLADWIEAARPKTLPAAIVPVLAGSAESFRLGAYEAWPMAVCMAFALLVQIGTNMANDYYDHIKGADTADRVGPQRMVASGRIRPRAMLAASLLAFAAAFLLGLSLVAYRGWELLAVGVASIVFGFGYTGGPFPLAYRGLGDVFVVLFFGLVATMGTCYVISGELSPGAFMLGGALGLFANNILVVNNYRDADTDRAVGKLTLVARHGRSFGVSQYRWQLAAAYGFLWMYFEKTGVAWSLLAFLPLPLALSTARALPRTEGRELNGLLARSALATLLTGALVSAGVVLGSAG